MQEKESGESCLLTTNDVIAGLLWLVSCHVRGRPLPGQALLAKSSVKKSSETNSKVTLGAVRLTSKSTSVKRVYSDGGGAGGSFGLAADMRKNLPGASLPANFMGNASCLLHIRWAGRTMSGTDITLYLALI